MTLPPVVAESRGAAARRWAGLLASTLPLQLAVQGLALVGGLYVVRSLPTEEYALYTIAHTALGAMLVVSDSGITSGVLAGGGRVWQDRAALGGVLASGLALRRKLALFVACVALPGVWALLAHHGAGWSAAFLLTLAVVPLFLATLTTSVLETVPRLHQRLDPLQRVQVGAGLLRFCAVVATVTLLPTAAAALLAAAPAQWWANVRLRGLNTGLAAAAPPDPAARVELLRIVARSMPQAIYYAVSSQLTVLLVALFGEADDIAAVGALSRLSMVLGVVGMIFTLVVLPRFARLPEESALLRTRYWQSQAALFAVCLLPVGAIAAAPGPIVALLGPAYLGFAQEAVIAAAGSAVTGASAAALSLNAARAVIAPPRVALPFCIAVQAALVVLLPVGTVAGVLWLGLLNAAAQWAMQVAYFEWRRRPRGAASSA